MNIQVLGICRFSLLVTGGFRKMPDDLDARRRVLYDPLRLRVRMAWFEHVLLPSIRMQGDDDFRLVVVTGEDFPEPWRGRLAALVSAVPQMELVFAPPGEHGDACRDILTDRMDAQADVVAQFRLDDDDALAADYVERVRSDFRMLIATAYGLYSLAALDHCHGLTLGMAEDGPVVHKVTASLWTPALTVYMPPGHPKTVLDYPHHLLFRRMPVLSLQDSLMFVRGVHGWNDSNVGARTFTSVVERDKAPGLLGRRFGIRPANLVRALAATAAPIGG